MRAIVVGYGEIGQAVAEVFDDYHDIDAYDPAIHKHLSPENYKILLVCFPYSDTFIDAVNYYRNCFDVQATIIFSTVAIGTTTQIPNAVHSPVEGKHPKLADGIRKMPRWVGGDNQLAIEFLKSAGNTLRLCARPEFTEFLKMSSTSLYGVNIEFARYRKQVCDAIGMDFELVKKFDKDYNRLYESLFMPQYQRYILDPPVGNVGGHCVVPNSKILDSQFPSMFLKEIYRDKEAGS